MTRRPKYTSLSDWRAVKNAGGDPGPRPRSFSTGSSSLDPTERLLAEIASGGPKPVPISSVQLEQKAANERRRKANKALEDAGLRPQPWV